MKLRHHSLLAYCLVASVLATGCSATNYGHRGLRGGYVDSRIDQNHYSVTFSGNGLASKERVWYFWIYRCAELTRSKGFTHFEITSPTETSQWKPAEEGAMAWAAKWDPATGDGITPRAQTQKAVYIYIPPVPKWTGSGVIAMYNEPFPSEPKFVLRAQSILDDLAPYVKSQGKEAPPSRSSLLRNAYTPISPSATPADQMPQPEVPDLPGDDV